MTKPTVHVPVRDASTVVLLRDGLDGIEAWLLTRKIGMVFAAGMTVFPGGRVEVADSELPFAGDGVAETARRFDCSESLARTLLGAAVRETFEETGVLLTAPPADLAAASADVEAGRVAFGDLLREHELAVDSSALHPWARWVTPAGEVRRYDTRFFVGALPEGAEAREGTSEASAASWVKLGDALEQAQRGERGLMPPTLVTIAALGGFASVSEALAAAPARSTDPISPKVRRGEDGSFIAELPDGSTHTLPAALFGQ